MVVLGYYPGMEIKVALGVVAIVFVSNFPEATAVAAILAAPFAADASLTWAMIKSYSDRWQVS